MFLRAVLAAIAVSVSLITVPALANNSSTLSWNRQFTWLQGCNDLQSTPGGCVSDPMGCVWGDEDDIEDVVFGKLAAGASTGDTLCLVTDMCNDGACPHQVLFEVIGPQGLNVHLTSDRGGSWVASPIKTKSGYVYRVCFDDPLWTGDGNPSDYPPIPSGGVGFVTHYTLTVAAAKTSQLFAGLELGQSNANGSFGYWHQLSDVSCP